MRHIGESANFVPFWFFSVSETRFQDRSPQLRLIELRQSRTVSRKITLKRNELLPSAKSLVNRVGNKLQRFAYLNLILAGLWPVGKGRMAPIRVFVNAVNSFTSHHIAKVLSFLACWPRKTAPWPSRHHNTFRASARKRCSCRYTPRRRNALFSSVGGYEVQFCGACVCGLRLVSNECSSRVSLRVKTSILHIVAVCVVAPRFRCSQCAHLSPARDPSSSIWRMLRLEARVPMKMLKKKKKRWVLPSRPRPSHISRWICRGGSVEWPGFGHNHALGPGPGVVGTLTPIRRIANWSNNSLLNLPLNHRGSHPKKPTKLLGRLVTPQLLPRDGSRKPSIRMIVVLFELPC